MKRVLIILIVVLAGLAACGSDDDEQATTSTSAVVADETATASAPDSTPTTATTPSEGSITIVGTTQFVDVYFVQGNGYATPAAVAVPATPDLAADAIRALIAGPTVAQRAAGLSSEVPTDTRLLGLSIDDGLARIDFSEEFEVGGGTFTMTARLAQVVYTLTEFSTIDQVEFWLEGEPVTSFSSEGLILDGPVGRLDYLAALPLSPTRLDTVPLWEQADLPDVSRFGPDVRRVVLVAADDVLNVRIGADVSSEILGMLAPGTVVALTGPQREVGTSTWFEIVTPAGAGWVNGHYLAETIDDDDFAADARVTALLDRLAEIFDAEGDLTEVTSSRGLYVSHHARPVRFTPDQLRTVLTDETTYKWPSNAIDVNDPSQAQEIPDQTFAQAIGDSFVSVWDDPDRIVAIDEPLGGGNGRLSQDAVWPMLQGFHYLSVHDPGDNPDYGGLDWISWHVSIDYEDGQPVVVGLTLDRWAP
jgi:spore germination protein GerM